MSYNVMVYAIDIDLIKSYAGSKNPEIIKQIDRVCGDYIDYRDIRSARQIAEGIPSARLALEEIINGAEMNHQYGWQYGYAVEYIIKTYGQFLDNNYWSATRSSYISKVIDTIQALGGGRYLSRLLYRGSPIDIPRIDDFPSIGFLLKNEVEEATQLIGSYDLSNLGYDLANSIKNYHSWLETAQINQLGLVSFYY